ncbi:hypothetical protein CMUS01_11499 [Colletotrichum musicola]|uniref:Uncharacterized protein n=1 Tax=Colletotrichum musicola TaxID=2175873 RepID=A0A8H6JXY2_9PEZI|nr:hypothetical protein CMUS01_11499 [Colletotrichum musicola]
MGRNVGESKGTLQRGGRSRPWVLKSIISADTEDDGDDGQGKGKDKKGGMRKRLSRRASTFFDAMRPSSQGSAR